MLELLIDALAKLAVGDAFIRTHSEEKARTMLDDPVYKENVRKLVERNRRFEETRE